MRSHKLFSRTVIFWTALTAVLVQLALVRPALADTTVRALWKVQEIHMPYFGLTTQYSCDGLRDRTRDFLTQLSVREDFVVSVACADLTGPTRNPNATIILASAVAANDELEKSFAGDPKRADLLAKMHRRNKTTQSDAPFDAVWQRVVLRAKGSGSSSAAGDCELLEHFKRFVLPSLGAKVISDDLHCTPYQGTPGNPSLEVEVLVPAADKS